MGSVRCEGERPRMSSPLNRPGGDAVDGVVLLGAFSLPCALILRRKGPFFLAVLHLETVSAFNL